MTAAEAPALELRGLTKKYGDTQALRGVSLTVARGEVFGYVGANGAGKSTTIKILTGLLDATSGEARVLGMTARDNPLEVKARIGYVPESGALYEKFTVEEYLLLVGRLYGGSGRALQDRISEWLEWFSLGEARDKVIGSLSKGTKQKVCWVSALTHGPDVLVLDEPLNGLDVGAVARVKLLMENFAQSGRTVFYSSHLMDIVEKVCSRVAVIHQGRVVQVGTPLEVTGECGSLEKAVLGFAQGGP